jgi:large subunit ribosomal protein L21
MYAVIDSGGKQYRVALGDRLKVESLKAEPGAKINLENVLMVADAGDIKVGTPHLDTAVEATVIGHGRGKKVRIFKMRRRKGSRQHAGHRQNFTELEITRIGEAKAEPAEPKTKEVAQAPESDAEEPKPTAPEATAAKDDLTQISGIGPVIVDKLNTIGITSLEQIAAFTEEDIERINGELNFKGRIERDDWVGQAQQLLKESEKES